MLGMRGNRLTWLGHAAFRIVTPSGRVLLIDPFLSSNPTCPQELMKPERVDVIFITHGHSDHLGDALKLRWCMPSTLAESRTAEKWPTEAKRPDS
jgi:L-ascorbate metabolism protein UlaG (beta-lactamase superfamily)